MAGEIQAVKERIDIVDLVSADVRLQKAGRTFKGLCPFHQERTPSFVVYPESGTWHCFGACATGGDVFTYVMRRENVDFGEALRLLAERAGVSLDGSGRERAETYARLYAVNEAAIAFFRQAFAGSAVGAEARVYAEQRGLDAPTVEAFEIGYAPEGWDTLKRYLNERGFDDATLLDAGLLVQHEERGTLYDRFRHRLIFPIRDERGRAVGFGGRALDNDARPKYLNTPQTPVFDKGALLYALDRARDAVRAAGEVVIVEGYLDAITAHQFGYRNVVATLGTALTERHIALLKRYAGRVTLAMDADAAGIQAALRGEEVARASAEEQGRAEAVVTWQGLVRVHARAPIEVRVFSVPGGKDPDEAIRADPQGWPRWVAAALPPFEFRLRIERARVDPHDQRARLAIADRMLPLLLQVSDPALQAAYLAQLAAVAATDEKSLAARLRNLVSSRDAGTPLPQRQRLKDEPAAAARTAAADDRLEAFVLALLLRYPDLRDAGLALAPELFNQEAYRELFLWWRAQEDAAAEPPAPLDAVAAALRALPLPPLVGGEAERALVDAVEKLHVRLLRARRRLLIAELSELDGDAAAAATVDAALRLLRGDDDDAVPPAARALAERLRADQELMKLVYALEWEKRTGRAAPWVAPRAGA
jgi:DNA primase